MTEFTELEISFLKSIEEARIATSNNNIPHVKPVSFVFYENSIIVATDYNTKSFQNIKNNHHTSIVIDKYVPGSHKAICVQGVVKIIESGVKFTEFYKIFFEKCQWVRSDHGKKMKPHFYKLFQIIIQVGD